MAADALVSLGDVIAGTLYLWTGWQWLDPATSLVIALMIVVGTWSLFKQSLHLLFAGLPECVDLSAARDLLRYQPGITGIHDLHV